jgi:hypothetical protein
LGTRSELDVEFGEIGVVELIQLVAAHWVLELWVSFVLLDHYLIQEITMPLGIHIINTASCSQMRI